MRYQGFISYSHAGDGKLAPAIQSALHGIAKPWYRLRSMRVFRDKSSLSANPALWPSIQQALAESDFFLLLASPEAASSKWVLQEVGWWFEHRPADKFLVLLTGGEVIWDGSAGDFDWSRTTALPATLRGRFANEPLWTDFRWARSADNLSLRHSQFRGGILDLAAPLLGRPKDEIDGEDVRQHRRLKLFASIAMVAILAFAVTAAWQAVVARTQRNEALRQRNIAEERQQIAVSRQLATQAELVERETSNVTVKSLLSVEAARRSQNGDAIEALARSLAVLPKVRLRDRGNIFGMALSPDGRFIALGIEGKSPQPNLLRVRDVSTSKQVYELQLPSTPSTLVFTPDGQRLIVGGFQVKVLDAATGRVLSEGGPKERALAISQDGRLALSVIDYGRPRVVDLVQQKELALLAGQDAVTDAAFSADGRYLTTWSYGYRGGAIVFDATNGRELFRAHHVSQEGVTVSTFSADSHYVASGSEEHTYIHSVPDGKLVSELPQGSWFVLRFSPDSESVASAPIFGGKLGVFSASSGSEQRSFPAGSIEHMLFSEDGGLIAISGDGVARVLETETGSELARLKLGGKIHSLSMSRDGKWFAVSGEEGVQLAEISNARNPPVPCLAAEITDDGRRLLCISLGTSMVLDTETGKPFTETNERSPMFAKLGNGGRFAVTTGVGAPFRLVEAPADKVLWEAPASETPRMTFSSNDRFVAFGFDKTIHVVQSATGKELARLSLSSNMLAQRFNQDESLFAVATEDHIVRIFDAANWKERMQIPQDGGVHALAFAAGKVLATGSEHGSLRIFDAVSGREVTHMPYAIPVMSLQFSQDGRYLLTLGVRPESNALAARIFDVASTKELWATTLSRDPSGAAASFADNDRTVVSFSGFRLRRHLWRADDLIAEACARLDRNLTQTEWRQYLGDEPYRKSCPALP